MLRLIMSIIEDVIGLEWNIKIHSEIILPGTLIETTSEYTTGKATQMSLFSRMAKVSLSGVESFGKLYRFIVAEG